jgi:hypothetical protein
VVSLRHDSDLCLWKGRWICTSQGYLEDPQVEMTGKVFHYDFPKNKFVRALSIPLEATGFPGFLLDLGWTGLLSVPNCRCFNIRILSKSDSSQGLSHVIQTWLLIPHFALAGNSRGSEQVIHDLLPNTDPSWLHLTQT